MMRIKWVLQNATEREIWLSVSDTDSPEAQWSYYGESNHATHEPGEPKFILHGNVDIDMPSGYMQQGYRPIMLQMPFCGFSMQMVDELVFRWVGTQGLVCPTIADLETLGINTSAVQTAINEHIATYIAAGSPVQDAGE